MAPTSALFLQPRKKTQATSRGKMFRLGTWTPQAAGSGQRATVRGKTRAASHMVSHT